MLVVPALPSHPFVVTDVAGATTDDLKRASRRGDVRRLLRGVYVRADVPDSYDLRLAAVRRVVTPDHIACDRTAAWIYDVRAMDGGVDQRLPPIEVCRFRGHEPTRRRDVRGRERDLAPHDVHEVHGLRVTTPLRTALDLGCILRRREAIAALDQFRRKFAIAETTLSREAVRYAGRRGVVQLRELIPLSDASAESPRESWTRLEIHDAGLPQPVSQFVVAEDGVPLFRLDFAYPDERIAVEYDGWEFHSTPEQRAHDAERRRWLTRHGWCVIVVRVGDFTGSARDRWIADLRHALRTPRYSGLRW